ncbi:unnamed protein product, partial [Staurois parvus]
MHSPTLVPGDVRSCEGECLSLAMGDGGLCIEGSGSERLFLWG